jgi:hypothetical protein
MRQQVAPQAGLSYSINDIGVIGRAMYVLASCCAMHVLASFPRFLLAQVGFGLARLLNEAFGQD